MESFEEIGEMLNHKLFESPIAAKGKKNEG